MTDRAAPAALPCPFCGGPPEDGGAMAGCASCTIWMMAKIWNRRAAPAAPEDVEYLVSYLRAMIEDESERVRRGEGETLELNAAADMLESLSAQAKSDAKFIQALMDESANKSTQIVALEGDEGGNDELLADLDAVINSAKAIGQASFVIVMLGRCRISIAANAALAARCEKAEADLATFANLARKMMDMHPGCVTCMKAGTTVMPGKFCPDCGWHNLHAREPTEPMYALASQAASVTPKSGAGR
jgi:hypothetical protein